MHVSIREGTASDRLDIESLYARMRRPPRPPGLLADYFVAVIGDVSVGCAAVQILSDGGYLFGLVVDSAYRRRGIGSALTAARVNRVWAAGGGFAVALSMFWNLRFFRSQGFSLISKPSLPLSVLNLPDLHDPTYRRSSAVIIYPT